MNCLKSNIPECSKFYGPGMSLEHLKLQKLSQFWCSLLMKDQDNFLIYRPLQWPRAPGLLQAWKQSWDPAKFLSATSSECSSVNFLSLSPSPQLSPRFKFDFGKEKMRKSQISAQQSEQKKKKTSRRYSDSTRETVSITLLKVGGKNATCLGEEIL